MLWLSSVALFTATAAMLAAFLLWRKVRRLQNELKERKGPVPSAVRASFDSVELSLEAMLEELEEKEREIMRKIDRREEELGRLFERGDALLRSALQGAAAQGAALHAAPGPARPLGPDRTGAAQATGESKAEAVRRLAEEGLDVLEIARRLGIGKGEVQLILDLKN